MKTKVIPIGNSKGIRIPKSILEQCHLEGTVEMEAEGDCLIIRSRRRPREGWAEASRALAASGEDRLLDADAGPLTKWDHTEWEW